MYFSDFSLFFKNEFSKKGMLLKKSAALFDLFVHKFNFSNKPHRRLEKRRSKVDRMAFFVETQFSVYSNG